MVLFVFEFCVIGQIIGQKMNKEKDCLFPVENAIQNYRPNYRPQLSLCFSVFICNIMFILDFPPFVVSAKTGQTVKAANGLHANASS